MIGDAERTLMTTIERRLVGHLRDAHALQEHAEAALSEMLAAAADEPELRRPFGHYAERSRAYTRAIEARLHARGSSPGIARDAGTLLAPVLEGGIGDGHRDPVRHMRDAYVAVHLQIAAGETLRRVADRAGDGETAAVAAAMCEDAHAMSHELSDRWDLAVDMSLGARHAPPAGDGR
ncbi:Ferritin-like metal-binding protein YciE [Actinomadura mexicana]|uniref:Ferritin-like metal-binding protein YciE n=2 Tax=Actinomadura mexicana TaxID=134959 RepID=A0A238WU73_9ACTN|nr:Ferritin-like metal-binding protein YciE [Actinomadura mexicana]